MSCCQQENIKSGGLANMERWDEHLPPTLGKKRHSPRSSLFENRLDFPMTWAPRVIRCCPCMATVNPSKKGASRYIQTHIWSKVYLPSGENTLIS